MTADTEALLPCPFCGGAAALVTRDFTDDKADAGNSYASCRACGVETPYRRYPAEATAAWNTRALPPVSGREGWQDIASAPKDGTRFYALHRSPYRGESRTETVWWQTEFDAFISRCCEMTMAPGYTIDGETRKLHSPDIFPATHWLCVIPDLPPLPPEDQS